MVWAHNRMNSRNDGERKNHIDDGERTAATTNNSDEQSTIYHFLFLVEVAGFTVVLASCSSVRSFPRNRSRNSHTATTTTNEYFDKASKSTQKWLDDDRQHRQTGQSDPQSTKIWRYFRSWGTRICKSYCCICSRRGVIVLESFACQRYVTNQTDGIDRKLLAREIDWHC